MTPAETKILVLLSALVESFFVSRMQDVYLEKNNNLALCHGGYKNISLFIIVSFIFVYQLRRRSDHIVKVDKNEVL